MNHRTNLPIFAALTALLLALPACSDGGDGGDGGGGNGGAGGGTGGDGGGDTAVTCEARASLVNTCITPNPPPADLRDPEPLARTATVNAVRIPAASEPCEAEELHGYRINDGRPEVMLDLTDTDDNDFTIGIGVPGFTATSVAVGDILEVDYQVEKVAFSSPRARLRIERDGALVVVASMDLDPGFTLGDSGAPTCEKEYSAHCGWNEFDATVTVQDTPAVTLPNGETADIGGLTITNDRTYEITDTSGVCDAGKGVHFIVGAVPSPPQD
ncbi:hypothetical protein [Chondromyces crocatus]|nr:hypothetical protein [Chondromyces crocatus]